MDTPSPQALNLKPLRTIDELFSYPSYRPGQKEMLEAAYNAVLNRERLMIDAPTGSGKSSLIIPLLAASQGKKILVFVRSNSQLTIFQNELQRIRETTNPSLRFSFIFGKTRLCPYLGENVHKKCNTLREATRDFFETIHKRYPYETNPLNTEEYRELMKENSGLCPYYARYLQSTQMTTNIVVPGSVEEKIRILQTTVIRPDDVPDFAEFYCPYHLLWDSLKTADVIILNYHYLLRKDIRKILGKEIYQDESQVILLLDEAHNIGELLKSINKRTFSERTLAMAEKQYHKFHEKWGNVEGMAEAKMSIDAFTALFAAYRSRNDQHGQWELQPPDIFKQILGIEPDGNAIKKFLAPFFNLVMNIHDVLEQDTFTLMNLYNLLYEISQLTPRSARYLCIERSTKKEDENEDTLDEEIIKRFSAKHDCLVFEVLYLDPGEEIQELIPQFNSVVMASGTLSPLQSFKEYYFGRDIPVSLHSVPNAFPPENRLVLATSDLTSLSRQRDTMRKTTVEYIRKFVRIPGNVAVFFTSYEEMKKAVKELAAELEKPLYTEPQNSEDAQKMMEEFRRLPGNGKAGIMFGVCGGKWFEGIDFRGDQLKAAFVVGFPLGVIDGYQKTMNAWFSGKLLDRAHGEFIAYSLPALNKAVQALGRVLRNADETGILVLGDYRYLQDRLRLQLPDWMRNEIRQCTLKSFDEEVNHVLARWNR